MFLHFLNIVVFATSSPFYACIFSLASFFSSNDIYATIEYAHRVVVDAVENILVNGN